MAGGSCGGDGGVGVYGAYDRNERIFGLKTLMDYVGAYGLALYKRRGG